MYETKTLIENLSTVVPAVLKLSPGDDFARRVVAALGEHLARWERLNDFGLVNAWSWFMADASAGRIPALAGYPRPVFAALNMQGDAVLRGLRASEPRSPTGA